MVLPWQQCGRWLLAAAFAAGGTAALLGLVRTWRWTGWLDSLPEWLQVPLICALGLAAAAQLAAVMATIRGHKRPGRIWFRLRIALAALVFGTALFLAAIPAYSYSAALIWWGCAGGLFATWTLAGGRRVRPSATTTGWLDLVVFNSALTIALLATFLQLAAWVVPSMLLAVPRSSADYLERMKCAPGTLRFGFPCNSGGFYDEEPAANGEAARVAVVGDSFVVGIVPHGQLFTTIAERPGRRLEGFGVVGAGPSEYRLLTEEAMALEPDLLLVVLFAGNDAANSYFSQGRHQGQPLLRAWLDRDRNALWTVLGRVWRLRHALRDGAPVAVGRPADRSRVGAPELETPTFSEAGYLEMEARLARLACGGERSFYDAYFADLEALAAQAGLTPLAFLLIPDEFQVEDDLWEALEPGPEWERDRPQRLTGEWLRRRDIPFLDLLPVLRGQPVGADGTRGLYRPRDSHLNARGNRVAGEALGAFLDSVLTRR